MSPESAATFSDDSQTQTANWATHRGPYSRTLNRAALVVLALLWAYAVYRLGTLWYSSKDYSYGWFVPLLCAGLFWERWQRRPVPEPMPVTNGPLIVFGGLLVFLGLGCLLLEVIPYWRLAGWIFAGSVLSITFCILLMLGGRPWVNHFAFPLLFFLVAVPWPSRIEIPLIENLSNLNAAISTIISNLLGTPAIRRGVLIETGAGLVGVDEACSGIRSFQATVMIALFLGELFRYSFFRRIFFLIWGAALAFGCNVVRTTFLVRTCDLKGKDAVNVYHDQAGFTMMGVTLAGLLLLAWILRTRKGKARPKSEVRDRNQKAEVGGEGTAEEAVSKLKSETQNEAVDDQEAEAEVEEDEEGSSRRRRGRRAATLRLMLAGLVIWVVLVELGMEAWFRRAEEQTRNSPHWTLQLPTQESGFTEVPIAKTVQEMLQYDEGRQAQWKERSSLAWQVYYLRWEASASRYRAMKAGTEARGHAPDVCLKNSGMTLQKDLGVQIREIRGITLRTSAERFLDQGRTMHIMSCYWDPDPALLQVASTEQPTTSVALRTAGHAIKVGDRLRNEKRVLKIGVWGMQSDEAATAAFKALLEKMIVTSKPTV